MPHHLIALFLCHKIKSMENLDELCSGCEDRKECEALTRDEIADREMEISNEHEEII